MDYLILLSAFGTLVLLFVLLRQSKPKDVGNSLVDIEELMNLRTELGVKNAELKHLKQKITKITS